MAFVFHPYSDIKPSTADTVGTTKSPAEPDWGFELIL